MIRSVFLSKLSIELEINFKMDILKVSKAKARKEGIKMNPRIENLKGKLIVSCQALPDEPLHSSFIMGRMVIYLDLLLPASSSDPPENRSGRSIVFISVLLRMRFTYALPVTSQAVSSYLTISPLPRMWRYISVALA